MRRAFALLLSAVMSLSLLTACGGKSSPADGGAQQPAQTQTGTGAAAPTPDPAPQPSGSTGASGSTGTPTPTSTPTLTPMPTPEPEPTPVIPVKNTLQLDTGNTFYDCYEEYELLRRRLDYLACVQSRWSVQNVRYTKGDDSFLKNYSLSDWGHSNGLLGQMNSALSKAASEYYANWTDEEMRTYADRLTWCYEAVLNIIRNGDSHGNTTYLDDYMPAVHGLVTNWETYFRPQENGYDNDIYGWMQWRHDSFEAEYVSISNDPAYAESHPVDFDPNLDALPEGVEGTFINTEEQWSGISVFTLRGSRRSESKYETKDFTLSSIVPKVLYLYNCERLNVSMVVDMLHNYYQHPYGMRDTTVTYSLPEGYHATKSVTSTSLVDYTPAIITLYGKEFSGSFSNLRCEPGVYEATLRFENPHGYYKEGKDKPRYLPGEYTVYIVASADERPWPTDETEPRYGVTLGVTEEPAVYTGGNVTKLDFNSGYTFYDCYEQNASLLEKLRALADKRWVWATGEEPKDYLETDYPGFHYPEELLLFGRILKNLSTEDFSHWKVGAISTYAARITECYNALMDIYEHGDANGSTFYADECELEFLTLQKAWKQFAGFGNYSPDLQGWMMWRHETYKPNRLTQDKNIAYDGGNYAKENAITSAPDLAALPEGAEGAYAVTSTHWAGFEARTNEGDYRLHAAVPRVLYLYDCMESETKLHLDVLKNYHIKPAAYVSQQHFISIDGKRGAESFFNFEHDYYTAPVLVLGGQEYTPEQFGSLHCRPGVYRAAVKFRNEFGLYRDGKEIPEYLPFELEVFVVASADEHPWPAN